MLARDPSLALKVKTHLKARVLRAEFADGRLPSEAALASELGVSRTTIRDALSRLEMEGVITRRQGAGTFAAATPLVKTHLENFVLYQEMIREHGYTPTVTLLQSRHEVVSGDLTRELQLKKNASVLVTEKMFSANKTPVILLNSYLPQALFQKSLTSQDLLLPIHELLARCTRERMAYSIGELVPLLPPAWLTRRLKLGRKPIALLSLQELIYNTEHQPVAKTISFFHNRLLRLKLTRRLPIG